MINYAKIHLFRKSLKTSLSGIQLPFLVKIQEFHC